MVAHLAAAIVSGQVLYEGLIVPRLPSLNSVPIWWWLAAGSPMAMCALWFGWFARGWRELVIATLAASGGWALYIQWAAFTHQPGQVNQPFAEASPALFWSLGLSALWSQLLPIFAIGAACRAFSGRR